MLDAHYLTRLFEPKSVAVVGASERAGSNGNRVFRNLLGAGFGGPIFPVNPGHATVLGLACHKTIESIGTPVDLAILTVRPAQIPEVVKQCSRNGVRHIILTTRFTESGRSGPAQERKALEIAHRHGIRVLGPASAGILRPAIGLHAAFSSIPVRAGHLAIVSQSETLCTTALDWASTRNIGFSSIITPGGASDIELGEILDYLACDSQTHAIALCFEHIGNARRFMSGLRSATRTKPVIVLKTSHRAHESDAVFNAAIERAGAVRVHSLSQWLEASKGLATNFHSLGQRLAIIGNGRAAVALAAGRANEQGIPLAGLLPKTEKAVASLSADRSRGNPVDIGRDATPEHYRTAIAAIAKDDNVDSILTIFAPKATDESIEMAHVLVDISRQIRKPLIACWMDAAAHAERLLLEENGIPAFSLPEAAIDSHAHLSICHQKREQRLRILPEEVRPTKEESEGARLLIDGALQERRVHLNDAETKAVLHAFRIPAVPTLLARTATEAVSIAEQLGFPVTLTINPPENTAHLDLIEIRPNLVTASAVHNAFGDVMETARRKYQDTKIDSVAMTPYREPHNGRKLRMGLVRDPTFGLVMTLAITGTAELFDNRAIALPPLNRFQTQEMIESIPVLRYLEHFPSMAPVSAKALPALENILLRLSDMAGELTELQSLELDPVIVSDEGVSVVNARIVLGYPPAHGERYAHMAIHPYPSHLEQQWTQPDGQIVTLRPIRPEDAEMEQAFVRMLSDESKHYRFMDTLRELTPSMLARFTQIDYDRDMALIATIREHHKARQIGVARYVPKPDGETVEFALVVADDWHKRGIGRKLMVELIGVARKKGYRTMIGDVLAMNTRMFRLVGSLGFTTQPHPDDPTVKRVAYVLGGKQRADQSDRRSPPRTA